MKFIKFTLRNRKEFSLPVHQAEQILDSNESLIKISENGKWNGLTVNKAEIVSTEPDLEAERDWVRDHTPQLPEPEPSPDQQERVEEVKDEIRETVRKLKVQHVE